MSDTETNTGGEVTSSSLPSPVTRPDLETYLDEFLAMCDDKEGYDAVMEKKGVHVVQKFYEGVDIVTLKGKGRVASPASVVCDLLRAPERRGEWDLFFESGGLLSWHDMEVGEKVAVVHYKTKTQGWGVWPRDFLLFCTHRVLEDGRILVVARSFVDDTHLPELPESHVRATSHYTGFLIAPISESLCDLTYLFRVDVAGWLPTSAVNMVNTYQPLCILGIRKCLTGSSDDTTTLDVN